MASDLRQGLKRPDAAFHMTPGNRPAAVPDPSAGPRARTMDTLSPGESGRVRAVREPLRERLTELGLLPGTRVDCLLESPMGDPKAYRIRGIVLAVRARDAAAVTLGVQP